MGERRVKIADVARACQLNRSTVAALYYDRAQKVDLAAIDAICAYLECSLSELFTRDGDEA
jgi:putative transcriptional regulator